MNILSIYARVTHAGSKAYRVFSSIRQVFSSVRLWNQGRLTRATLSRLSDHELDDIGFVRGDIDDLAYSSSRKL